MLLNAETSILAAANPENGNFRRGVPVLDDIVLESTILSGFDLAFVFEAFRKG
jgi:DNA replicative helicase MCM subunit Mcm2 (Cdc46/Mcm family)